MLNPERWKYYDDEFSQSGHKCKVLYRGVCILTDQIILFIFSPLISQLHRVNKYKTLSCKFAWVCLAVIH